MAQVFRGSVAGEAQSDVFRELPQMIISYTVANKSGSSTTFSAYVNDGVADILISPDDCPLDTDEMYSQQKEILMIPGDRIKIVSAGEVDFYFSIMNVKIES